MSKKPSKVSYLDGLRGIACLIVLTDHWFLMGYNDATSRSTSVLWASFLLRSPLRLLVDGGFAVAVFFVLSGYVLLIKYFNYKNREKREIILAAMIRRYPRLMIPSFVALLMYFSWLHFGPWEGYSGCHAVGEIINSQNGTISFSIGDIVLDGVVGQWFFEPAIYTIEWTLQIELLGSWILFVIALGMVLIRGQRNVIFGYSLALILIPILGIAGVAPLPLQYLESFLIGMLLAEMETNGELNKLRNWRYVVSLGGHRKGSQASSADFVVETPTEGEPTTPLVQPKDNSWFFVLQGSFLFLAWYLGTCPYQITLGSIMTSMWLPLYWMPPWLWLSIGAGFVLLSLLTWKEFQNFLSSPISHFLGRISFAVYLMHYQVLILTDILIMPYLGPATNTGGRHDRTLAAFICYFFVILPTTVLVAYLFTKFVDETAIAIAQEFSDFWKTKCSCLRDNMGRSELASAAEDGRPQTAVSDGVSHPLAEKLISEASAGETVPKDSTAEDNSPYIWKLMKRVMAPSKWYLLAIFIVFLVVGCIPGGNRKTCYVDDDNN